VRAKDALFTRPLQYDAKNCLLLQDFGIFPTFVGAAKTENSHIPERRAFYTSLIKINHLLAPHK